MDPLMSDIALRQALGYRPFAGPPRGLFFESGHPVVRDAMDAARELGCEAAGLPLRARGAGDERTVEELLKALLRHRPDFVFTVNHLGLDEGAPAQLLQRYEVPAASWF